MIETNSTTTLPHRATPTLALEQAPARPRAARKFTLLDAMILVAATGVAMVPYRAMYNRGLAPSESWTNVSVVSIFAAAWTAGVLAMRLVAPRPSFRRLLRQPGALAALMAVIVIAGKATYLGVINAKFGLEYRWFLRLTSETGTIGLVVLAAWFTLLLSGRWRIERNWLDRLGRLLGGYWVILSLIVTWYDIGSWRDRSVPAPPRVPWIASAPLPPLAPPQGAMLNLTPQEMSVFSVATDKTPLDFKPPAPGSRNGNQPAAPATVDPRPPQVPSVPAPDGSP